jgi:hypothetical protein
VRPHFFVASRLSAKLGVVSAIVEHDKTVSIATWFIFPYYLFYQYQYKPLNSLHSLDHKYKRKRGKIADFERTLFYMLPLP